MKSLRISARFLRFRWHQFSRRLRRPAGGPLGKFRRRYLLLSGVVVTLIGLVGWTEEVGQWAGEQCRESGSDAWQDQCYNLGLPNLPNPEERAAWRGVTPGSCKDLSDFLASHPDGFYHSDAREKLSSASPVLVVSETDTVEPTEEFIGFGEPMASERDARADAIGRATTEAEGRGCPAGLFADPVPEPKIEQDELRCITTSLGFQCSLKYTRVCRGRTLEYELACN